MSMSVALFKKLETIDPSLREVLFAVLEETERQQKVFISYVWSYEFDTGSTL